MSTYTGVSNSQKTVRFFGPSCIMSLLASWIAPTYGSVVSKLMTVFIREMMAAVGGASRPKGELVVKL